MYKTNGSTWKVISIVECFLGAFVLTDFGHELSYLQSELGFEIGMLGSTVWWRGWYA